MNRGFGYSESKLSTVRNMSNRFTSGSLLRMPARRLQPALSSSFLYEPQGGARRRLAIAKPHIRLKVERSRSRY